MRLWPLCRLLLPGLLACAAPLAQAACESGLAERMYAKLRTERVLVARLAACKAWPAHPGRLIVALPLAHGPNPAAHGTLDLELLLIQRPDNGNTERDTVLAHLSQPGALNDGAARIQDIQIDTARYILGPEQRAFGLRVRHRNNAPATPFANETLRLYLPRGNKLQPVLAPLEIERDNGEWDLRCTGRFEQLRTQVQISRDKTEGLANLVLSRTLSHSRTQRQDDGQCSESSGSPSYSTVTLRYDGQHYPLPAASHAH